MLEWSLETILWQVLWLQELAGIRGGAAIVYRSSLLSVCCQGCRWVHIDERLVTHRSFQTWQCEKSEHTLSDSILNEWQSMSFSHGFLKSWWDFLLFFQVWWI